MVICTDDINILCFSFIFYDGFFAVVFNLPDFRQICHDRKKQFSTKIGVMFLASLGLIYLLFLSPNHQEWHIL
jgi:hypothetical protein